ncbi:MAG: rhodanese-like domain-containing protein, partial [Halocynthiibacter sp.]
KADWKIPAGLPAEKEESGWITMNERQAEISVEHKTTEGYGGDVTPKEAWRVLSADPAAQLVDVRSAAEWVFVGVPELSSVNKVVHFVEWQRFPGMARVAEFENDTSALLKAAGVKSATPIFFLCRSGGRSMAAARALTALGQTAAFNILSGFEGDPDADRHRGNISGWKSDGLPWVQK